jgi:hypothetical protein
MREKSRPARQGEPGKLVQKNLAFCGKTGTMKPEYAPKYRKERFLWPL